MPRVGAGRVYYNGNRWWIDFSHNGTRYRESSQSYEKADAEAFLRARMDEVKRRQEGFRPWFDNLSAAQQVRVSHAAMLMGHSNPASLYRSCPYVATIQPGEGLVQPATATHDDRCPCGQSTPHKHGCPVATVAGKMMDRLLAKNRWLHKELAARIGLSFSGSEISGIGRGDKGIPLSVAVELEKLYHKQFAEVLTIPGAECRDDNGGPVTRPEDAPAPSELTTTNEGYLPARMISELLQAGWSPADLARECGGSESTLRNLRCDHHKFSTRISMAAALGRVYQATTDRVSASQHPAAHLRALVAESSDSLTSWRDVVPDERDRTIEGLRAQIQAFRQAEQETNREIRRLGERVVELERDLAREADCGCAANKEPTREVLLGRELVRRAIDSAGYPDEVVDLLRDWV